MDYHDQLISIQKATDWPQETLAKKLGVSFPALNAWVNQRSKPRKNALKKINDLFIQVIGTETIDLNELNQINKTATKHKITAQKIIKNQKILDTLTLNLTYHSDAIEGSTMTLNDVKEVILDGEVLSNRTAIEQAEARNHKAALHWLLDRIVNNSGKIDIDEVLILEIHLRLMNGIISDAGQYRKHTVRIMGSHVTLANYLKIPRLVKNLESGVKANDTIGYLAEFHAKFEKIHPFTDGNGRVGRLLLIAQALSFGMIPPIVAKERKIAYYKYLEIAQTTENYHPLEFFLAESMNLTSRLFKDKLE